MAAPQENLLSLMAGTERNTFTKQTQHGLKKSVNRPLLLQTDFSTPQHLRVMHLQRHWQELKERELAAQEHNRQLLQQFGEAQDTLREMLTLTAAMKTIRTEYERYLEESAPRWQQQLREKTKAAQKKQFTRMEEYLKSHLKNPDERATKSSAEQPSFSQGLTAMAQKHYSCLDYNQDGSSHVPYMQPPWQPHPQPHTARFPFTVPYQPQSSSYVPSSFLPPPIIPPPHPLQLHPLASAPGHHHWSRQNPPSWTSPQADCPWSRTGGAPGIPSGSEALWGQLYREAPPLEEQVVGVEPDTSTAPSSRRERGAGSRSSHLSQELDIKPVRLSSWPAESGESTRESSKASTERRKKREKKGRSRRTSSDRERRSSKESYSSAIITAAVAIAGSSESDSSLEKTRSSTSRGMRRSGGLDAGSPNTEKVVKKRTRSKGEDSESHKDESQSEEMRSPVEGSKDGKRGDQSPDDESGSCRAQSGSQREEESESVSIKIENGACDDTERPERSSSDESSAGEKGEKDLGDGGEDEDAGDAEEKEDSQSDEEQQERDVEEDDEEVSERKTTTEEEEDAGAEESSEEEKGDQEEKSDGMKEEDVEDEKQGSSSQDEEGDEDESEGEQDNMEKDESEEEKESDQAREPEEERDSDDSIILPQNKSKKIHVIPEEASKAEDGDDDEEEESKTGSSDNSGELSDEDDVEHLLAPQVQPQKKEEKELRADEKQKAHCDKVEIFQVDKSAPDHSSDSDEFDHFYD